MYKKITAIVLSCLLLCACFSFAAFAEDTAVTLSNAAETGSYVIVSKDFTTPLRLTPATLTADGETQEIWLVMMLGVKNKKGQVNSVMNCLLAAFNLKNSYYTFVKDTVLQTVPAGSKLVFACHSLGGMVAQQLRTDAELQEAYEILHVVTFGSPHIMVTKEAEGSLSRMIDSSDAVPFLSPATLIRPDKQFGGAHRENGGFGMDFDGAHNKSYLNSDVWGGYDALGNPGGSAAISFDSADITAYGDAA